MTNKAKNTLAVGLLRLRADINAEIESERVNQHHQIGLRQIGGDRFAYEFGMAKGEIIIPREIMDEHWQYALDSHKAAPDNAYLLYARENFIARLAMIAA